MGKGLGNGSEKGSYQGLPWSQDGFWAMVHARFQAGLGQGSGKVWTRVWTKVWLRVQARFEQSVFLADLHRNLYRPTQLLVASRL